MEFQKQPKGFSTKAIHSGQSPEQWTSRSVIPQICMSTTFKQDGPGEHRGFEYSRSGNPTRNVLEICLASLDNAKYGLTFSSGLGTITTVLSLLSKGDHLICGDDVYGGTNLLLRQLADRSGISYTFVDATNLAEFESAFKSNTKLVWIETPTNPLLKVIDIKKVAELTHRKGHIILAVDNTFLTSYFQRPLELGADLTCYSISKYMNGHTDIVMGGITMNSDDLYEKLKFLQNAMGIIPSPFDCYQVNRSLKTLSIRMEQHQKSSIAVARYLENHPLVEKVQHPGLESHPQHSLAIKQSYGHSGVFSFYLKGSLKHSQAFFKALKVFTLADSLGGFESLVALPCIMTHADVPEADRKILGITDSLIRISVGLEDIDDLINDLQNALKVVESV